MKATTVLLLKKSFVGELNQILLPPKNPKYTMPDIYSGCGGLSLGFEAVGFKSTGIDADKNCCRTYNHNLVGSCKNDFITPKYEFPEADIDVCGLKFSTSEALKELDPIAYSNGMSEWSIEIAYQELMGSEDE